MGILALTDVELVSPEGVIADGILLIEAGEIIAAGPKYEVPLPAKVRKLSLPGRSLVPGFIDLHTHGLLGKAAFGSDLAEVIRLLPRYGVTSFLAATLTLPMSEMHLRLEQMAEVLRCPPPGAQCKGIHLEGNFLSPKLAGMANPSWLEPLTLQTLESLQKSAGGFIRMVTLAPEEGETLHAIPSLVDRNVIVSVGHSGASFELVEEAVRLGLRHATHTFNGMPAFHHRAPGVVGAVMALPEITAELIADGHHVHPGAMRMLINAKGVQRVCLVSDSSPLAGLPAGNYAEQGYNMVLDGDTCRTPDGRLAGSCSQMDTGFRNLIAMAGLTPPEASSCASRVPAQVLDTGWRAGLLRPGHCADLVVLDLSLSVEMTFTKGDVTWSRTSR